MNPQEALQNVWRELNQRRLLPVAVLLVGALVAVPFLLAKDPAPTPAAPTLPTASAAKQSGSELEDPVVSLVADGTPAKRRRVLGYSKNPFAPAAAPKVKAASTPGPRAPRSPPPAPRRARASDSTGGVRRPRPARPATRRPPWRRPAPTRPRPRTSSTP